MYPHDHSTPANHVNMLSWLLPEWVIISFSRFQLHPPVEFPTEYHEIAKNQEKIQIFF